MPGVVAIKRSLQATKKSPSGNGGFPVHSAHVEPEDPHRPEALATARRCRHQAVAYGPITVANGERRLPRFIQLDPTGVKRARGPAVRESGQNGPALPPG